MKKILSLFLSVLIFSSGILAQVNRADTKKSNPYRANYQRISSSCGADHSLEIRGGQLWAWGRNFMGQLGDGTTQDRSAPIQIGTDDTWVTVSTGATFSIGIKSDGSLWGWGDNMYNGTGTYLTGPMQIGTAHDWVSISCGDSHTLALKSDGTIWTWGYLNNTNQPEQIGTDNHWASIAAGSFFNLAIKSDGSLWAWGDNEVGQLGDGTTIGKPQPVQIGMDHNWTVVSGGYYYSVGIKSDGSLWAWGDINSSTSPVQLGNDHHWVSICGAYGPILALKAEGTLWNIIGGGLINQIGNENDWVNISSYRAQAAKADGSLWNVDGSGNKTLIDVLDNHWLTLAGGAYHTLAIKTDGSLWAWGANVNGSLGDGTNTTRKTPVQIGNGKRWTSVSAGSHSLALQADGSLWAWGYNANGELGDGSTLNKNTPVQIGTDHDWVSVEAGSNSSFGLKSDGSLWAWGRNDYGQLGTGLSGNNYVAPVRIGVANDWVQVSAGVFHTLALKSDGSLWAWGQNTWGELGIGSTQLQPSPVRVGNLNNWIYAEAGGRFSHAIQVDGSLWGWGLNAASGAIGNGSNVNETSPVQVGGGHDWIGISSGDQHCLAVKSAGTAWTWGGNFFGELGNGTNTNSNTPIQIILLHQNTFAGIAGSEHSIFLHSNRETYCASGLNQHGELGNGTFNDRKTFACLPIGTGNCTAPPAPATVATTAVCSGSSAVLNATGTGTLGWYDAASGGQWLGGGSSFTTPPITGTTTFYVQDSTCSASSTRAAITVTLKSPLPPETPYAPNETICNGESGTLVGYGTANGVISWYDAPTGGNYLGSGYVFHTPPLYATSGITSFYFYLQDSLCSSSERATALVEVYPSTIPIFDPIAPVCYGSIPPVLPSTSTNFDIPGTWSPATVSNTASGTYTFYPLGEYLECNVPVSIFIEVIPAATADIINNSGTTLLSCITNSISITATGGVSYSWSGGLGNQPGAVITTAGTYTVTVTNANGCSAQATITITGTTGTVLPPVVSGPVNVCNYVGTGQQVVFTVPVDAAVTSYTWTVPPTINIVSGQGNDTLIVTIGAGFVANANKQIRVKSFSACGASSIYIHYLTAQLPGTPPPISGPADVCTFVGINSTAIYSINAVAAASSYDWTVPVGAAITENNGTNIKVGFNAGFNSGVISVRSINNCGTSSSRSLTVKTTRPSTPGLISGPTNTCLYKPTLTNPAGLPATYSIVKNANVVLYNWTVPTGANIISHTNTTTEDIITVSFTNSYSYGNISVTAENNCGISSARILSLNGLSVSSPGLIYGSDDACGHIVPDGTLATYYIDPVANANYYNWTLPAGISGLTGQGTNSISFFFPFDYESGTISVFASNACGNSGTRSIIVRKLIPERPDIVNITETQSCPNRIYQYSIPSMPNYAQSILWTIPAGATLLNGQGTLSISVAYPSRSFNDKVSATAQSDCGISSVKRLWIVLPACTQPITGNISTNKTQFSSVFEVDNASLMSVDLFPNPSTSLFNIKVTTKSSDLVMINLLDVQGRLINKIKLAANKTASFGNDLNSGIYIIEVRQGSIIRQMKAIKL